MKIVKVADKRDSKAEIVLLASVEDVRNMRPFVGHEVEVAIEPILRFKEGDLVDYSSVIGEKPTLLRATVLAGPFNVCGELCWSISGVSGVVADDALRLAGT